MTAIRQTADVVAAPPRALEQARFCSRCSVTTEEPDTSFLSYGFDRVCRRCGMGVMLSAPRKALPASGGALIVVRRDGTISAVSEAAEKLLGDEAALLSVPVTSALAEAGDESDFARVVARAAGGRREIVERAVIYAGRSNSPNGRINARIASCGLPRAALLVLERAPA